VVLGASPRASLGLLRAAKSFAVMQGRPFVTPDDVRHIAPPVLAHRLILVPELEGDSRARSALVEEAIHKVGYRRAVRPV
jgi:MoxR-like ATPase